MSATNQTAGGMEPAEAYRRLREVEEEMADLRKKLGLHEIVFPHPEIDGGAEEKKLFERPNNCPFCESGELSAGDYDGGAFDLSCDVTCGGCGGTWTEHYRLASASDFAADGEAELCRQCGAEMMPHSVGAVTIPMCTGCGYSPGLADSQ